MDQRRPDISAEIERGDAEDYSCNEAKKKRVLEISKYGMAATSAIVLAFFAGRRDITSHASPVYIALCASFTILAFTTCFLLMLLTSDSPIPAAISINQTILIYLSTLLLMLTAASLLILLNIHYATMAILLLLIMVITGTLLYHGIRSTYQARGAAGYKVHESELRFFFSISAFVTFLAFGLMIPTIFSHYKNFSAHADRQLGINRVPECYMFFTVVSGLVTMLLILLPPSLGHSSAREEQFVTAVKVMTYSLFGLLAMTGLTAAAAFLGELVVLVFFPDIIGATLWLVKEFFAEGRRLDQVRVAASREGELEPLSMVLTASTFTALMTIYSAYPNGHEHSFHLRICTFFIASAFLSSLGRMLLTVKPPSTRSMAALVKTLSLLAIGMVAAAVPAAVFFLAGDPDKVN